MKRFVIPLAMAFAFFTSFALAEEQYLCTGEIASGFYFNKSAKIWQHTKFEADSKYTISKAEGSKWAFVVRKVGDSSPIAACKDSFDEAGLLFCKGAGYDFRFNRNNGRYLSAYLFGYFTVLPESNDITDTTSDTPFIEIGTCSPI